MIFSNPGATAVELSEMLGRSVDAVRTRRTDLRTGNPLAQYPSTRVMNAREYIASLGDMPTPEIYGMCALRMRDIMATFMHHHQVTNELGFGRRDRYVASRIFFLAMELKSEMARLAGSTLKAA